MKHSIDFHFFLVFILFASLVQNIFAQKAKNEKDDLFESEKVLRLKIEIPPNEAERIKAEHRPYVRGTLEENEGQVYSSVGIKLKGAAGSFREFEDRPCLTLNVDKFKKNQSFHGLDKFHLNNSVQDESYLNEIICSELFRAAGCPSPRVTYARVWLNGRDLGLYVLKEGFDSKFLKRHFENPDGNLYDGGFLQDLDAPLEKDEGDGPDDLSDLHAIVEAIRDPDPKARVSRIADLVDIDAFLLFMALERMTCHWDGYCLNMNNYRLYFDPGRGGKAVFLPQGMDQMFGEPEMNLLSHPNPLLSAVVMQSNDLRKQYREKIHALLPLFSAEKLISRVDERVHYLRPVFIEFGEASANAHLERVRELKERICARIENLKEQAVQPDPEPKSFDANGIAFLTDWYPVSEVEDAKQEEIPLPGKKRGYLIQGGPSGACIASWRCRVLLGPGTYRFVALCQTTGVLPLDATENSAAGIRISRFERNTKVLGTSKPTKLSFEFSVLEDRREVELVAELKAKRGKAVFEKDSLQLIRLTK